MQTNELADRLGKFIEQVKPYSNLILGAVLVVVLGIVAAILWAQQSTARSAKAWEGFYGAMATGGPAELEQIVKRYPGTDVAHWAAVLAGDLYSIRGSHELFENKPSANEQLVKATNHYGTVLKLKPTRRDAQALLVRKFSAMSRLVKLPVAFVALFVGAAAFYLAFFLGLKVAEKLGITDAVRYWVGAAPVAVLLLALAIVYLALPSVVRALGQDPTPPGLAMLQQRASYGLARAYESLAGTQGGLDKAIKTYEELVAKWPQGAYCELATRRLEELERLDTKDFYDKFAKFEPRPPLADGPGGLGQGPAFDLDNLSDEGAFSRVSEALGLDDAEAEETMTDEESSAPAEPDAPPAQDQPAPEQPAPEQPAPEPPAPEPEETSPEDSPEPETTPAEEPSPAEETSGQE
ncbi:MAG: hypothetical protein ABIP48_19860 [Planctomycetota bacterium]